jgi:hypothetical protein
MASETIKSKQNSHHHSQVITAKDEKHGNLPDDALGNFVLTVFVVVASF